MTNQQVQSGYRFTPFPISSTTSSPGTIQVTFFSMLSSFLRKQVGTPDRIPRGPGVHTRHDPQRAELLSWLAELPNGWCVDLQPQQGKRRDAYMLQDTRSTAVSGKHQVLSEHSRAQSCKPLQRILWLSQAEPPDGRPLTHLLFWDRVTWFHDKISTEILLWNPACSNLF